MSTMLLYDLLSHITQHTLRYFSTAVYKEQQEEDIEKSILLDEMFERRLFQSSMRIQSERL